jgi:hypothetical protein
MAATARSRYARPMLPPRLARILFRVSLTGFLLTLAAYGALCLVLAHPGALFAHARGNGTVTFHSSAPLPDQAEQVADDVMAALHASPLGPLTIPVDIYMVDEGWPMRLFFVGSPEASGLTYPVLSTRNVFLRYVDLPRGRLSFRGQSVPPPRTLRYYLVHEVTHLMLADRVGRLGIVDVPIWVNEGFADYVALGPAPPVMVALAMAGHPLPRMTFGSYPLERVCVTLALNHLRGDLEALFALQADIGSQGTCPVGGQFGIATGGSGS